MTFVNLVVLCLSIWMFPALLIIFVVGLMDDASNIALWLYLLFIAGWTYKTYQYLIGGVRDHFIRDRNRGKLVLEIVLATLVSAGPFIGGAIAYTVGFLLTWYWPLFILFGFGISGVALWLGFKMYPEESERNRLPSWIRYCDAIKAHKEDTPSQDRGQAP